MFILLSIGSIFSSMFITLFVATTTLDGLPPYRMVLNCFHLFWTILLIYFELFWYILLGWFYRLIIVLTFKLFNFKLFIFKFFTLFPFTILLCFHSHCPSPFMDIYIYIYIYIKWIGTSGLGPTWVRPWYESSTYYNCHGK